MLKSEKAFSFDEHWPNVRPTILKLLHQDNVSREEWHDLFWAVHSVCLWDEKGPPKVYQALEKDISDFIILAQERVLNHQEDEALLKAYITEWRKFFAQCSYLPKPFNQLETTLQNSNVTSGGSHSQSQQQQSQQNNNNKANIPKPGRAQSEEHVVRKLMLDCWNKNIFSNIKTRLQDSAMKFVQSERNGEAFDSQLVIGVRESYVNLCSNSQNRLEIYKENFERAYIEATEVFYRTRVPAELTANGVQGYMTWAHKKLEEETERAGRYLETSGGSQTLLLESCVNVLVTAEKDTILSECAEMIKQNKTDKLNLMFRLIDRVADGIKPMLDDLEKHIMTQGLDDMVAAADTITQDSEKYVEQLLNLFERFSKLVREAFNDDPRFLTSRDKAFKHVVNDTAVFKLELAQRQRAR